MPPKNQDVVNSLMRAAAGVKAKDVDDDELDQYIVDMLTKEAKEKHEKYKEVGVEAFQLATRQKQKPKPNTRFLLNVVKATDSHNQAVIKANDENVAKMRRERLDKERQEREAKRKRINDSPSSSRHQSQERSPTPEKNSRSRSPTGRRSRSRDRKRRHRSKSPTRKSRARSSSPRKHKDRSPDKKRSKKHRKHHSPPKDVQYKGRGKVRINVSSMDKYFAQDYDPLFDIHSDEEKPDLVGAS